MRTALALCSLLVALTGCPPQGTQPQPPDENTDGPTPSDPVEHAAKLMQAHKLVEAEKVIDDALAKDAKNHELLYAKGVVRREQDDVDGAMKAWEQALAIKPDFFAPLVAVGAIHLDKGEYDAAIAKFQAALQINPDFADAHYNLGLALLGAGKRAEAIKAIENANKLAPHDPDIAIQLSQLYATSGREKEAVALAEGALGEVGVFRTLANLALGDARLRAGDPVGAEAAYRQAIEGSGHAKPSADGSHPISDAQCGEGDACLAFALDAKLGLGRALARQGKLDDAVKELEGLHAAAPKSGLVLAEWGGVLAKKGDLRGAIAKLDQALALEPLTPSIHVKRIAALAEAKRCKEAKAAHEDLRSLNPPDDAQTAANTALLRCKK